MVALTADRRGERERGDGLLVPHALGDAEGDCLGLKQPRRCRRPGIQPPLPGICWEDSLVPHGT
jgi:hypothetical protein